MITESALESGNSPLPESPGLDPEASYAGRKPCIHTDVFRTGRFPGDDKPKPIAFPDPATTAIRGQPFALLPIERWIELKLASGMVAPHRLKDLADVQELIRSARLPDTIADSLHPWVRPKFVELWFTVHDGAANDPF